MKVRTFKNRFLGLVLSLVAMLTTIPMVSAQAAEYYYDGLGQAGRSSVTVYSSASTATYKGNIYSYETFTILGSSGNFYNVEYSTSSGTKTGYVQKSSNIFTYSSSTYVANVLSTSTVYFGPGSSSYETVGTVFAGENVVVLRVGSSWNMIEYNTSSGRKRGYVPQSCLSAGTGRFKTMAGLPVFNDRNPSYTYVSASTPVYSGPTIQSPVIGYVDSSDNPIIYSPEESTGGRRYVRYRVNSSNKYKTGYILP